MRILQVISYLPPNHLAGVEVYTDRLIQSQRTRHDVGVYYAETAPEIHEHELRIGEREGVPAFEVIQNRNFLSFEESYESPALREASCRVLDAFRPDLVHVQHLMNHSLSLLEELRVRDVACVMTAHDHWLECAAGGNRFHREWGACDELDARRCGHCMGHMSGPALRARAWVGRHWPGALGAPQPPGQGDESESAAAPGLGRTLPRWLLQRGSRLARLPAGVMAGRIERRWQATRRAAAGLDLLLAPSHFMEGELLRFGIAQGKVRYCEHGFPTPRENPRRALPATARHFVFVGSLVRHKGAHLLLEAFEAMPADATLTLCGWPHDDPAYAGGLRSAAKHPGVRFAGRLAHAEVEALLAQSDCLVVPSIWSENAPLVVKEAHLAGIPVIASRRGGHIELLAQGGGLLYDAESTQALGAALRRVASEAGLARSLAASAPAVRSQEEHTRELDAIYDEVLQR